MEKTAHFHLPGLFEFYDFYKIFLQLYFNKRKWFYEWIKIDSIYGSPADCIWGGGRVGFGEDNATQVLDLLNEYKISARLTFSNSLLKEEHLLDKKCNSLCSLFAEKSKVESAVIVHSDLLLKYLKEKYPNFYFVSSTTKVITDFEDFFKELSKEEFKYVVPDFRLNKRFDQLSKLPSDLKDKVEFLCNECCWIGCKERKSCYENVSLKNLGAEVSDHICKSPEGNYGYRFSKAMENPAFIGIQDIENIYLPMGFSNFKIEGRGLGSAILLEMLLHYLVKKEFHLKVREELYLDCMLDLF